MNAPAADRITNSQLAIMLLLGASLAAFFRSFTNGFVLDDLIHITGNPSVRTLSGTFLSFSEPMFPGSLYRPLVVVSYGLTYALFEYLPLPYHAVNILLHSGISVLLFFVLRYVLTPQIALAAALLFAVHPLHVEVVANVSGRAELLCHFFGLSALLLACSLRREKNNFRLLLVGVCALACLLSKESGVIYVLLFFLLQVFERGSESVANVMRDKKFLFATSAFLLAVFVYFCFRFAALGSIFGTLGETSFVDNPLADLGFFNRFFNASVLLGKYLFLSFFPFPLSADYSFAHLGPLGADLTTEQILYLILLLLLLCLSVIGFVKRSVVSFAFLWFLIAFLVSSNLFFPIGTIFGERLAYLPSVAACIVVAFLLAKLPDFLFKVSLLLLIPLGVWCSGDASKVWHSQESLFSYQMKRSPRSVKTLVNYSVILRNAGEADEALRILGKAFEMRPEYPEVSLGMGAVWIHKNNLAQAEFWLKRCLELNPSHEEAMNLLGRVLLNQGRNEEARGYLEHARVLNPNHVAAGIALMGTCLNLNDLSCARRINSELSEVAAGNAEYLKLREILSRISNSPRR